MPRARAAIHPASTLTANIDVGEWAGRSAGMIEANSANQVGVLALHALYCGEDYARIGKIHATVAIQVVHPAIAIVIDDHVGGVTELMPAVARAAALIAEGHVVIGSTETGKNVHCAAVHTMPFEILNHELELVE